MPTRKGVASIRDDPFLEPFRHVLDERAKRVAERAGKLAPEGKPFADFAAAHEFYGLHRREESWVFREWAPNATSIRLVGDFTGWRSDEEWDLHRVPERDVWEIERPLECIRHGQLYHLEVRWESGWGERIPAYARRVTQDSTTGIFSAQVWDPPHPHSWRHEFKVPERTPLIYEAHIGMAQEKQGIGTYREFREHILPRVIDAGYNTLQLMAIMEHPYYASFGYQISSFYAASSRFGTPEELKELVDVAHGAGLAVIMDLVHSHAVRNEREGLSRYDGTYSQFFHDGSRGWHDVWDSRCFDYGKIDVLHFLLSNCRFWLDEYHFDGFRFDGVTSMLYLHHGLGVDFLNYQQYFDDMVDPDACVYLALANRLIHEVRPDALTVAEDVSGMPGLAAPVEEGGTGFDYRMAMGVPECWFKLVREIRDEDWSIGYLWHELTNRRDDEQTINYVESHDQSLVGGKTLLFQMMDSAMYDSMHRGVRNLVTDRAVALHRMIRLTTIGTAGHAYLNFMGNEFGHPEWIDFPREGNRFSYQHARRLWHLRDDPALFFHGLAEFDRAMLDVFGQAAMLSETRPRLILISEADKILVFSRGDYLIALNFHSQASATDFPIAVPPGEYVHALDTDREEFGGQERIAANQRYPVFHENRDGERIFSIRLYLPCRTGLVLRRKPREDA